MQPKLCGSFEREGFIQWSILQAGADQSAKSRISGRSANKACGWASRGSVRRSLPKTVKCVEGGMKQASLLMLQIVTVGGYDHLGIYLGNAAKHKFLDCHSDIRGQKYLHSHTHIGTCACAGRFPFTCSERKTD